MSAVLSTLTLDRHHMSVAIIISNEDLRRKGSHVSGYFRSTLIENLSCDGSRDEYLDIPTGAVIYH